MMLGLFPIKLTGLAFLLTLTFCHGNASDQGCIRIEGAVNYRNQNIFLFYGNQYIKFDLHGNELRTGKTQYFGGYKGHVDAAVTWTGNNKMYLFQGSQYFKNSMIVMGPWDTDKWDPDFAEGIDAAGNRDGATYFFKGCRIVRMGFKKRLIEEELHNDDIGLPCDVDAAFSLDNALYVIKGDEVWEWADHVEDPVPLRKVLHLSSLKLCPAEH